jgi:3-phytase
VPAAVLVAVLGVPAATAAPATGLATQVARNSGVGPSALFGVDDSLPTNPDLLRQLMWVRSGKVPAASAGDLRVATLSAGLSRSAPGRLADELSSPGSVPAQRVAETVQRAAPDVVLLTDFDVDGGDAAARSFRTNYLAVGTGGQEGIDYPYVYTAEVNNGVDTGADLDDDGVIGGPGDSFGPGEFAGQHGMVLFSRHPLDTAGIRTFRDLRWDTMPGNAIPDGQYTELERSVLRLSSTAHWDIPVKVDGRTVHVLAAQPADPSAGTSAPERHHDEMRLWADYIAGDAEYLQDDDGRSGGLAEDSDFVLVGDFGPQADADLDDDHPSAITALLEAEAIQDPAPESAGALAADAEQATATRVSQDGDGLQLVRSDYVLPSSGLPATDSGVFWPADGQLGSHLTRLTGSVGDGGTDRAAERRLVWTDLGLD